MASTSPRRFMNSGGSLVALALLAAWFVAGCSEEQSPVKNTVRPVKAIKVGDSARLTGRWFPGRAKATEEVDLSFRVSGPLVARPVKVGDVVEKGYIVARIDPRDFEVTARRFDGDLKRATAELKAMQAGARPEDIAKLKAAVQKAEAQYKLAQVEYNSFKTALETNAVSELDFQVKAARKDQTEAHLQQARENLRIGMIGARTEDIEAQKAAIRSLDAQLDSAKDRLSYTYLRAPFSGVVAVTYVENFETVQEKQPIIRLLDTSRVEMIVNIPESGISLAPYVENIRVVFDAFPDRHIPAEIKEIGTEASATTRTYPITLIMDQPKGIKILPGMAGKARGEVRRGETAADVGVEIPVAATFSPDETGQTYVWVIDEQTQTVSRREVTTGELTSRGIVIRRGLEPGEWVATAGVHYLREGQQVTIVEE